MSQPYDDFRLRCSARTNRGRVRQNNEDSIHLWADTRYALAVVADGMGGAVAGEKASRIAIETVQGEMLTGAYQTPDAYRDVDELHLADKLQDVVLRANQNIVARALATPELKGMGTTLTMAFARYTDVVLAHVGDSRAYLIDGHTQEISQITTDHSFVQALVEAGHITAAEADDHPMKNVLYRALGQADELDVDVIPDVLLNDGDRLVLCSDGLTLHLSADEIAEIAAEHDDPDTIVDQLIETANERGGRDNISVIVMIVDAGSSENALNLQTLELPRISDQDQDTLPITPLSPPPVSAASSGDAGGNGQSSGNGNHTDDPLQYKHSSLREGSDISEPFQ
jgi:PPM family protein phosphatase